MEFVKAERTNAWASHIDLPMAGWLGVKGHKSVRILLYRRFVCSWSSYLCALIFLINFMQNQHWLNIWRLACVRVHITTKKQFPCFLRLEVGHKDQRHPNQMNSNSFSIIKSMDKFFKFQFCEINFFEKKGILQRTRVKTLWNIYVQKERAQASCAKVLLGTF